MRALLLGVIVLVAPSAPASDQAESGFAVHEWGTFTSFAGSDGVHLEFRPLVESDLPAFVYDRARQAGRTDEPVAGQKGSISATQRMETPVTYFYTDREREIDVRVEFPQGLLTEFYPPVTQMSPPYDPNLPESLRDSALHWASVRLIPSASATVALPAASGETHYGFARETDSAFVRTTTTGAEHVEKFLFYRGVGTFSLPMKLTAYGNDRFTVESELGEPGISAFLIEVEGGRLRFERLKDVVRTREFKLPERPATLEAIRSAMVSALTTSRLYPKEAEAMIKTWESSWFGEEGTRLLYVLPQTVTDRILPLAIQPPPHEIVRVMVGRLEVLTPEREAALERDIGRIGRGDAGPAGSSTLSRLGRFGEPALRRIATTTKDAAVRQAAERLLSESLP